MPQGKGLESFKKELSDAPPKNNTAIFVGSKLFHRLEAEGRISIERWHVTGMPSLASEQPTLDKKYWLEKHPLMDEEEYLYK